MLLKSAILLLCALWASADVSEMGPPNPSPPPILPNTSTTAAPTSAKTTVTTVAPNSTTTEKPTTTRAPDTTTSSTAKPTSTSTAKPTTTTVKPTPSPSPTPKPDDKPSVNDYIGNITNTKDICFMAKMAIQVEINSANNTSIILNVPKTVQYKTDCSESNYEFLAISWGTNQTARFIFFKNNSKYEIQNITLNLNLPDLNQTMTVFHNKSEFSVSEKLSYLCSKDQALNLTSATNNSFVGKIHLSHLQYQAFMNTTDPQYASVWNCDGANTSDVVPVVVGCVLAILVVLALVGYLFGRRRCQARGYLSMFAQERSESDYIPMKTLSCFK